MKIQITVQISKFLLYHHLHWDDQEMGTAISFMQGKAVKWVSLYLGMLSVPPTKSHQTTLCLYTVC